MNSHLLSALDAEESTNGKGFASAINYGDDVISSDKDEEDEDDEIIIVDKDKSGYSLRTTGPPRPQPPLSRQHKDAQDFSSKDIGRIPKISSPKTSVTLPKTRNNTAKTFQSYKPSNSELGNRQKSQKRSRNDDNSEKNSPGKSTEIQQPTITLFKTSNQLEPIIIVNSAGKIGNRELIQGVLQISTKTGQNSTKTYRIIPHSQLVTEASSNATEVVDLSGTPHAKNALPTQMTPAPGKCQKIEVISRLKKLKTTPSSSSATEDSKTEIDDDDDDGEKDFIHCALCANCGIKSKNLNKCDSCKCNFSKKKYQKLIPIPKEDASGSKNNVPLTPGSLPIQRFYPNKSNTFLLPVKKQQPPSTSKSDNWKEKPRLKTYSQRKTKKPVQPVCISISSDEDDEVMSQDEGTSNGLDTDSRSRSPTFERTTPQQRSNGRVQLDSVFTDEEDSELSCFSHHRTNDGGRNVSSPRVSRKQKMRDQHEKLLSDQKDKSKAAKFKEEDLSDCSLDSVDINLQNLRCVSVEATHLRIGSQEYKSRTCVEFLWNQIVLHLSGSPSRLELKTAELTSCVFCLSSSLFTMFLKTVPAAGVCIRNRLKMDNHSRYDPGSNGKFVHCFLTKLTRVNHLQRLADYSGPILVCDDIM
ncbi:uncharacterized protein LOC117113917 [Anneissia japonica]|uniref:uncharacterized protein LOC117113917 n=1 Tax=Anneissia japonica TaxID=1529436 RepID=UPI001425A60C|nr:uncharacterized protein LOC117113917 [Anneissia japonica]